MTPTERVNAFAEWMQNKIKSIHYANNNAMNRAYEKIYNT